MSTLYKSKNRFIYYVLMQACAFDSSWPLDAANRDPILNAAYRLSRGPYDELIALINSDKDLRLAMSGGSVSIPLKGLSEDVRKLLGVEEHNIDFYMLYC